MKMFAFKTEMPTTIEDLNKYELRRLNDEYIYDTVLTFIYAMITFIMIGMMCSFISEKLSTFSTEIQKSFYNGR